MKNPALTRLLSESGDAFTFAQVAVTRNGSTFEVRHSSDADKPVGELKSVNAEVARTVAQSTKTGEFRPLKSAPNLANGWAIQCSGESDLAEVLNQLYPGALADWLAAKNSPPPVTNFREYAASQTGMYRNTAKLSDAGAARVIAETCNPGCLKRRLWTVPGCAIDAADAKSIIPCLDVCALFMEAARKASRAEYDARQAEMTKASEGGTLPN